MNDGVRFVIISILATVNIACLSSCALVRDCSPCCFSNAIYSASMDYIEHDTAALREFKVSGPAVPLYVVDTYDPIPWDTDSFIDTTLAEKIRELQPSVSTVTKEAPECIHWDVTQLSRTEDPLYSVEFMTYRRVDSLNVVVAIVLAAHNPERFTDAYQVLAHAKGIVGYIFVFDYSGELLTCFTRI